MRKVHWTRTIFRTEGSIATVVGMVRFSCCYGNGVLRFRVEQDQLLWIWFYWKANVLVNLKKIVLKMNYSRVWWKLSCIRMALFKYRIILLWFVRDGSRYQQSTLLGSCLRYRMCMNVFHIFKLRTFGNKFRSRHFFSWNRGFVSFN